MDRQLAEKVFHNPYLIEKIMSQLDVRSLFRCCIVSKEFFDAAYLEHQTRKDIVHHLVYQRDNRSDEQIEDNEDTIFPQFMFDTFRAITKDWINMRPKLVIVFVAASGYMSIDYRRRETLGSYLMEYLPKDCRLSYIHCTNKMWFSFSPFIEIHTNLEQNTPMLTLFTHDGRMPMMFFPDIDGLQINTYTDLNEVKTKDVKTILLFISSKKLSRLRVSEQVEEIADINQDIHYLMLKCGYEVAFGGCYVEAAKNIIKDGHKENNISEQVIITFGGNRVRTASIVITGIDVQEIQSQLIELKNGLDFDIYDLDHYETFAIIFSKMNFIHIRQFKTIFPETVCFAMAEQRIFGKRFMANDPKNRSQTYSDIDPETDSTAIVLVNIELNIEL